MDRILLGKRIREAREERDISLDTLASAIGLNKSTLSRYERAEIVSPKLPVIQEIGKHLHVNPSWLIGLSDDKTYTPSGTNSIIFTPCNLFSPLKTLRTARGLSTEEAAFKIGISADDYIKIENGHNTDCITLARIANFFCCSTDFVLAFDGTLSADSIIPFVNNKVFRLHHSFEKLSAKDQERVISFADSLASENSPNSNIIRIAGRDGSYQVRHMTDEQIKDLVAHLDQLGEFPDDL